jgi:hypothetical protein
VVGFQYQGILANSAWIAIKIRHGVLFVTMKNVSGCSIIHDLKEEKIDDK